MKPNGSQWISGITGTVRSALGKAGFEVRRVPRSRQLESEYLRYLRAGSIPWSSGYGRARERLISEVLANPDLLEIFRRGAGLPGRFGVGLDERCVEYPWVVAHLHDGTGRLLDAGSTLNHAFVLDHPVFRQKKLYILTLAPEARCFWHKGVSYLFDDLRSMPFRDDYFGSIACVSTLEHVGCDNSLLTRNDAHRENRTEDFTLVMREFRRVLKPGGVVLLTVPFGVYRHFGAFQQFDQKLLLRAVEGFGEAREITQTFYRYTAAGWNVADAVSCAQSRYVEWVASASLPGLLPTPLPVEPDMAAAARAVACLRLTK